VTVYGAIWLLLKVFTSAIVKAAIVKSVFMVLYDSKFKLNLLKDHVINRSDIDELK